MINGLIGTTDGDILIDSENIKEKGIIELRRSIGYSIQGSVLFHHMAVEENISYVPNLLNKKDRAKTRADVSKWMKIVGLDEEIKNRYLGELSGGQQQRVGIARALATSPEILLMDEPFDAVDEISRAQLQQGIKRIHEETKITIMFVTHDISEAFLLGTKVLVMNKGDIEQYDAPVDILKNLASDFVAQLVYRQRHQCNLPDGQIRNCQYSFVAGLD